MREAPKSRKESVRLESKLMEPVRYHAKNLMVMRMTATEMDAATDHLFSRFFSCDSLMFILFIEQPYHGEGVGFKILVSIDQKWHQESQVFLKI